MRIRFIAVPVLAALAIMSVTAAPAMAIIDGEKDIDDRYPNVGMIVVEVLGTFHRAAVQAVDAAIGSASDMGHGGPRLGRQTTIRRSPCGGYTAKKKAGCEAGLRSRCAEAQRRPAM